MIAKIAEIAKDCQIEKPNYRGLTRMNADQKNSSTTKHGEERHCGKCIGSGDSIGRCGI